MFLPRSYILFSLKKTDRSRYYFYSFFSLLLTLSWFIPTTYTHNISISFKRLKEEEGFKGLGSITLSLPQDSNASQVKKEFKKAMISAFLRTAFGSKPKEKYTSQQIKNKLVASFGIEVNPSSFPDLASIHFFDPNLIFTSKYKCNHEQDGKTYFYDLFKNPDEKRLLFGFTLQDLYQKALSERGSLWAKHNLLIWLAINFSLLLLLLIHRKLSSLKKRGVAPIGRKKKPVKQKKKKKHSLNSRNRKKHHETSPKKK